MTSLEVRDPATCAALHEFHTHHVDLELEVDMVKRRVAGVATLSVKRLEAGAAVTLLRLDVFHLVIHSVCVALPEEDTIAAQWSVKPFTTFGDALEVEIPDELAQASAFELTIRYETDPESPGVCWLEKEQTAGKTLPFMYTQGQEVLNRSFFPCQDSPSVRVTYTASVVVPKELVCVMSAKLLDVEDYVPEEEGGDGKEVIPTKKKFIFEMKQSIPVYMVAMAVGDLVEAEVGPRSSIWTEPCMIEAATKEFDGVLEEYLEIGERLFGDYLWERYDMLVMPPSFPYGGMENPRLTFVSPCTIAGDKSLVSIVAHELSHSWFGNLVTNATWSDFFLNEGFTMYAERRITEVSHGRPLSCLNAKLGEALLREEISSLGEQSPLTRLRVPLDEGIDPGDCYNQCAYEKGYAFVCYLRSLVGSDEVFDDFLKRYCAEYRFQSIPAETMIAFFLKSFPELANAAGTDLEGDISFNTWLNEPGYPLFTPNLSDAQEIMQNCESLAFHWRSSSTPVQPSVLYLSEEAKKWEAQPVFYFLDCCLETKFPDADVVIALGDTLSLWNSHNSEILFRWALVLIKNTVVSKLFVVRRFLEMQGKQKFQLPVYRLLASSSNDEMRKFASETYAATKSMLHVMVRDRIELLLGAKNK
ncbi:Aminopeptidase B [Phytophthora fragariae]|uniref:Aminopeptidase B n=1 Tax=Phytophthora fragariae TaxID=53985 RepID=A0A6A3SNU9_9STRA|nr:Aminopeptidase B [Phytophthora fragariae]KAE8943554.1 Aminopeptidase B [Phytophthora fragariae]KAE9016256.1 Aminopeptidase B [Phytophthora fragariae]KAE9120525.1 Aminopeptidase B [Phytophthora fragariae]KAE9147776.1 Aminopeptidase B [Phytophthora fragariae]